MAGRVVVIVVVLLMTDVVHVDACYLRNCPVGGKRTLDDALVPWIDRLPLQPHDVSSATSTVHYRLVHGSGRPAGWVVRWLG